MEDILTKEEYNSANELNVGEVIECEGRKIKCAVVTNEMYKDGVCSDCFFLDRGCLDSPNIVGDCRGNFRDDKTDVLFIDVTDEDVRQN